MVNDHNLKRTEKYRTIHSISINDIKLIDKFVEESNVKSFLDYGCHMGHLSIYLALTYNINVLAVDNFVGTIDDELMTETIEKITGEKNGNFKSIIEHNIAESSPLKGNIELMYSNDFHERGYEDKFDMAYIDSSHREEENMEFQKILKTVKIGGIISGHDYHPRSFGGAVVKGVATIKNNLEKFGVQGSTWYGVKK